MLHGIEVRCLRDTGAQVSTLTESFYRSYLERCCNLVDVGSMISISAASGRDIPFVGYVELDLVIDGCDLGLMGFLIVKDPVDCAMGDRKEQVPGVLGSNVFRDMNM